MPSEATLARTVDPVANRTNTSAKPLASSGTRFEASDAKTTVPPCSEIAGRTDAPLAPAPSTPTETRRRAPVRRSMVNTSRTGPFGSSTMSVAWESKATSSPVRVRAGFALGPFALSWGRSVRRAMDSPDPAAGRSATTRRAVVAASTATTSSAHVHHPGGGWRRSSSDGLDGRVDPASCCSPPVPEDVWRRGVVLVGVVVAGCCATVRVGVTGVCATGAAGVVWAGVVSVVDGLLGVAFLGVVLVGVGDGVVVVVGGVVSVDGVATSSGSDPVSNTPAAYAATAPAATMNASNAAARALDEGCLRVRSGGRSPRSRTRPAPAGARPSPSRRPLDRRVAQRRAGACRVPSGREPPARAAPTCGAPDPRDATPPRRAPRGAPACERRGRPSAAGRCPAWARRPARHRRVLPAERARGWVWPQQRGAPARARPRPAPARR